LLRDLWHMRGQVFAAGIVVACGIAAFVTMRSAYHSLVSARAGYYTQNRFADVFAHLKRAPGAVAGALGAIPGVAVVEARIVQDVTLSVPGLAEPATGRLISIPDGSSPALNGLSVLVGRLPTAGRVSEVLASEAFARANGLQVGDSMGAILNGQWTQLTITGLALSPEYIYEVSPAMIFPDNRRFGVMWASRGALEGAFDMTGAFNDVALRMAPQALAGDVIAAVDRILAPYGGVSAYGRSEQASHRFLSDELGEIKVTATYVPAIFLGVSAFLLYTLLARMVSMERGQIALLKAFGFSNARVGLHYLAFALLVVSIGVVLGGALGGYLGSALVGGYRQYFHFPDLPFRLPLAVVMSTVMIAVAAAALGSLAAVWRAARLPPAEAMRAEPPKNYRAGALEATGMARWLGAAGRVIARNVARRPWRALLSVVGIAAAVATVLLGRFVFDAVNHLVAVHFDSAQRDDVTVVLVETSDASTVHELARLPGVMRAEPFRLVPVRLRFGHREKRTGLMGIASGMDMKQLVDSRRRRIEVPPDGLVLTRKLAGILGVQPGDVVTVEQLDGRRLSFPEPVVKLSDEPLGISGYMDSQALGRALHEQGSMSGALLKIDRTRELELYSALKRMPAVGAVAIRAAMLETIRNVMNRSFILMTIVMTAFAAVLVSGVVYNSARIALSERGNELASLRVLGFSKGEVTRLLLGEQGLLTLVAIPLGLLLGTAACRLLVPVFDREMFRLPFVLTPATFAFAALVTLAGAILSGYLVARRIGSLDLVAVLKSRE
jgi:putative ABC transport system permease protein